jgi:hypothetical protein
MDQHKPTAFYVVAWDRGSGQQIRRWRLYPDMETDAPVTAVDANNPSKGFTLRDDAAGDAVLRTPDPQYPHSALLPNSLRRVTFQATVGRVAAQDREDVFLNLQAEEYVDGVLSLFGGRVIVGVSGDSASRAPVVQVWDTAIRPPPVLGWVGRLVNAFARDAITRQ